MRRLGLVLLVISLAGCPHDVNAVFPARGAPGGTVVIELTTPAEDLTVAVDGALVARHAHSQRVVVTGVPVGAAVVDVAFGGGWYARAEHHQIVDVAAGVETAVVIAGPERSTAGAIESGLVNLGSWIFLGLTYAALLG
jgi:hypothetical protein